MRASRAVLSSSVWEIPCYGEVLSSGWHCSNLRYQTKFPTIRQTYIFWCAMSPTFMWAIPTKSISVALLKISSKSFFWKSICIYTFFGQICNFFFWNFFAKFLKKTKFYFKNLAQKCVYTKRLPKNDSGKKIRSNFLWKLNFLILCYGCYWNWFWGHSPRESRGHCASENIGVLVDDTTAGQVKTPGITSFRRQQ